MTPKNLPTETVKLMTDLMTRNAEANFNLIDSLYENEKKENERLRAQLDRQAPLVEAAHLIHSAIEILMEA